MLLVAFFNFFGTCDHNFNIKIIARVEERLKGNSEYPQTLSESQKNSQLSQKNSQLFQKNSQLSQKNSQLSQKNSQFCVENFSRNKNFYSIQKFSKIISKKWRTTNGKHL